jgi:hypothetical protein
MTFLIRRFDQSNQYQVSTPSGTVVDTYSWNPTIPGSRFRACRCAHQRAVHMQTLWNNNAVTQNVWAKAPRTVLAA